MAVFAGSPTNSIQHGRQVDVPMLFVDVSDVDTRMRVSYFSYTHSAGAGDGEINLVRLGAGRLKILSDLSRLVISTFGASAVLDLGHRAYTDESSQLAVSEASQAFEANLDVNAGPVDQVWTLPANGIFQADTQEGLTIFAEVKSGNIEDTDTIEGYVVYQGRD